MESTELLKQFKQVKKVNDYVKIQAEVHRQIDYILSRKPVSVCDACYLVQYLGSLSRVVEDTAKEYLIYHERFNSDSKVYDKINEVMSWYRNTDFSEDEEVKHRLSFNMSVLINCIRPFFIYDKKSFLYYLVDSSYRYKLIQYFNKVSIRALQNIRHYSKVVIACTNKPDTRLARRSSFEKHRESIERFIKNIDTAYKLAILHGNTKKGLIYDGLLQLGNPLVWLDTRSDVANFMSAVHDKLYIIENDREEELI